MCVCVCVCACVRACVRNRAILFIFLCNDNSTSDMPIFYRSAAEIYELAKPYIVIILGSGHTPQARTVAYIDCHILHVSLISSWFCKHTVQLAALMTGY